MFNVLIVDDELEICSGLKNYFPWESIGFSVSGIAENGAKAVQLIEEKSIDVVMTDVVMPVMDGMKLAKYLNENHPEIKIVLLSAYKDFEYAKEAFEYGVKGYVVKPTRYDRLMDVFVRIKLEMDKERKVESNDTGIQSADDDFDTIDMVKKFIKSNLAEATLTNTARHVHLNPFYLSSYFKHNTGETFTNYLIRVRMEKAAEYLLKCNYKIYEISEMVGYSDAHNFTRMFKSYYKMTPRSYKKNFQSLKKEQVSQ